MNCENNYCVYWKSDKCTLHEISLDIRGCCQNCIYIDVDSKLLDQARQRLLRDYEEDHYFETTTEQNKIRTRH